MSITQACVSKLPSDCDGNIHEESTSESTTWSVGHLSALALHVFTCIYFRLTSDIIVTILILSRSVTYVSTFVDGLILF